MRFLSRLLVGLFILALTVSILILAGGQLMNAMRDSDGDQRRRPPGFERIFAANVDFLTSETITPFISTFGTVQSSRSVEIRASVGGTLVELSPHFRNGGHVAAGDLVFQIDPAKSRSALALTESQLLEARSELAAARAAMELAKAEVEITKTQRELRVQALSREQSLQTSGMGTGVAVENAAQALASAEQALLGREQALATVDTRIWRAESAVERSEISLADAQRNLAETRVLAPFAGVLGEVSGVLGRLVSSNEKLAVLSDPSAMEVEFRLSYAQFSRLVGPQGKILQDRIITMFDRGEMAPVIGATIVRIGAEVGEGQTGRLVYAQLDANAESLIIPGDFLEIRIEESPVTGVAQVPASAVSSDGLMLILGENERLEEIPVTVLRRQGDVMIVKDIPFGREYITERVAQLGSGIQVRPLRPGDAEETPAISVAPAAPEMIVLDKERRARLIASIQENQRMPEDAKARLLEQLNAPEIAREVVERLESRMRN